MTRPSRLVMLVSTIALTLMLAACGSAGGRTAATPAPVVSKPVTTGRALVVRFFTLLEHRDVHGLRGFLSPAFQLERADGSGSSKSQYLTNLPAVKAFSIADLTATQSGDVLVTRYMATAEGLVNGKPYTPGPAPRLSVFSWNGRTWQLAAHANFNPLTG